MVSRRWLLLLNACLGAGTVSEERGNSSTLRNTAPHSVFRIKTKKAVSDKTAQRLHLGEKCIA